MTGLFYAMKGSLKDDDSRLNTGLSTSQQLSDEPEQRE